MIRSLSSLRFEVSDVPRWRTFAAGVLGLGVHEDGGTWLRMDERHHRVELVEGPADDLAACVWEGDVDAVGARLAEASVPFESFEPAHARRGVRFHDPAGIPVEVVEAPRVEGPFTSPLVSGFVTGDQGMGHCVLAAPDLGASLRFYTEVLGLRHSDRVATTIHGHPVDITFLHANPRHHSVAFPATTGRRIHHFLVEMATLDDVGFAFSRACAAGVEIVLTLGRHPNDHMVSFYARTPSGFEFEVGWGGLRVDDTTWTPRVHDRISAWGHVPPAFIPRVRR